MYHPGINNVDISEMTNEEIYDKISDLNNRIGIAYTTGNTSCISQIELIIMHYKDIIAERNHKELQDHINADPKLGATSIDIDWPDNEEEDNSDTF